MKYLIYILPFITFAQTPLSEVPLETYTPLLNVPEYLEPFINTQGKKVTKISQSSVFNVTGQQLSHNYSTDQTFNSNNTLIKLAGYPAAILSAQTYEFLFWANIPSLGRWSNTMPEIIFGTTANHFIAYNVLTGTSTILHTFNEPVSFGLGEGNQDINDRFVALVSSTNIYVFDLVLNSIIGETPRLSGDLDWVSVSPLGNYVLVSWRPDGTAANQGLKKYNITLTEQVHLSDHTEHYAMGILENNTEVYVQFGNPETWSSNYYLEMINLDTNQKTGQFYWDNQNTTGIWGGHLSMTVNKPGYVFVNEGCCIEHTTLPNEIFSLRLNQNTIERFGKAHSSQSCRASVSRDGQKIVFSSDFFGNETNAYIIEKSNTLSSPGFNTPKQTKSVKYYDLLGRELKMLQNRGIYIVEHSKNQQVKRKLIIK